MTVRRPPMSGTERSSESPQHIGILLFDDVEELEAVGPWEVLSAWTLAHPDDGWNVTCVSEGGRPVTGAKGLVLGAHHAIGEEPRLDVLIHPGGMGTRPLMRDESHLDWVRTQRQDASLLASV